MVKINPIKFDDIKGKKNFSCDVNFLIGHQDIQDSLHPKIETLFQSIANYDYFLFFNIIKASFLEKISYWITTSARTVNSAVLSVIRQLRKNQQNTIEDEEFIHMVESKIDDALKSIGGKDIQKIKSEITRITSEYTYTSLVDDNIRQSMLERNIIFSKLEGKKRLEELAKEIGSITDVVHVDSYLNDKTISMLNNYQDFKDHEDRTIAQEII